jgi:hypothetical protein
MKISDGNKALAVLIVIVGIASNDVVPIFIRWIASVGALLILLAIIQTKKE